MAHVPLPRSCCRVLNRLREISAPHILLQLVAWVFLAGLVLDQPGLDTVEFFAGRGALTESFRGRGFNGYAYEILTGGITHDFTSKSGFVHAIRLVLNTCPGGLIWLGVVCSSWVFMSRSSTGRRDTCILGSPFPGVLAGNIMASRAALIIYLAEALGHVVIVEQPSSSLLRFHPRLQEVIGRIQIFLHSLRLGHYMADSAKPLVLMSNVSWLGFALNQHRCRDWCPSSQTVYRRHIDEAGVRRTTGDTGLKGTQTYPLQFGLAVAFAYREHAAGLRARATCILESSADSIDLVWLWSPAQDLWHDAILAPVFEMLREIRNRGAVA